MTAQMLVYAIIVIVSVVFWAWLALSNSRAKAPRNDERIEAAANPNKTTPDRLK